MKKVNILDSVFKLERFSWQFSYQSVESDSYQCLCLLFSTPEFTFIQPFDKRVWQLLCPPALIKKILTTEFVIYLSNYWLFKIERYLDFLNMNAQF